MLDGREERLARQHGLLRFQGRRGGQPHGRAPLQGVRLVDQGVQGVREDLLRLVVGMGDGGADATGVGATDVNVARSHSAACLPLMPSPRTSITISRGSKAAARPASTTSWPMGASPGSCAARRIRSARRSAASRSSWPCSTICRRRPRSMYVPARPAPDTVRRPWTARPDVSARVPAIHPFVANIEEGGSGHTPAFAAAAGFGRAREVLLAAARAGTGVHRRGRPAAARAACAGVVGARGGRGRHGLRRCGTKAVRPPVRGSVPGGPPAGGGCAQAPPGPSSSRPRSRFARSSSAPSGRTASLSLVSMPSKGLPAVVPCSVW